MKKIKLTKGYETLVDDDLYQELNKYNWYASKVKNRHYARRDVVIDNKKYRISMHRYIMELRGFDIKSKQIDHKDRDSLNNQSKNFRITSYDGNNRNRDLNKNNKSGYKGVYWCTQHQRWIAKITINYKDIYLGSFMNKIDAAKIYNKAAIKYHGEFAFLNKI